MVGSGGQSIAGRSLRRVAASRPAARARRPEPAGRAWQAAACVGLQQAVPDVHFLARRFEDCELEGPFEAVVESSVVHHLDVPGCFRRMHDLLAPGGRIAFAEPNFLNPQVFLERYLRFVKPLFW